MSVRAKFSQIDVTRALRGTVAAGLKVAKIEIDQEGRIVILAAMDGLNHDQDLDRELAQFETRHG